MLSCVRLFATPWTVAHQAPPSMEVSRQEYWSGQPFPSPGNLPDPGLELGSHALQADSLPSEPTEKPEQILKRKKKKKTFWRRESERERRRRDRERGTCLHTGCQGCHSGELRRIPACLGPTAMVPPGPSRPFRIPTESVAPSPP